MARAAASGLADGSSSAIGTARCWRKRPERLGPIHSRRDIETEFFNRIDPQLSLAAKAWESVMQREPPFAKTCQFVIATIPGC